MKFRHVFLLGLAVLIGLLVVFGTLVYARPYVYRGTLYDPPAPVKDFTLPDQAGQPFHLGEQKGNVVLIFFGYTNCPDVCPVTLSDFRKVKEELGNEADRVRFVFVSVDPERDTPERVGRYLASFDASITGLTAPRSQLEPVWKSFGVYQAKVESGSASGYLVDHTALVYVIDPEGDLRLTFPFGMQSQEMAADVRALLGAK
jgi:protein SCO1/2